MNPRFWIAAHHNNNRFAAAQDKNTPLPVLRFIADAPDSKDYDVTAVAGRGDLPEEFYWWFFRNRARWDPKKDYNYNRVLYQLAKNRNLPEDLRLKLARTTEDQEVLRRAVERLPAEINIPFLKELAAPVLGVKLQTLTEEPKSRYAERAQKRFQKLVKDIEEKLDEVMSGDANRQEAEYYSTYRNEEGDEDNPKEIWVKANSGDVVAVDGEIVDAKPDSEELKPPEDYVEMTNVPGYGYRQMAEEYHLEADGVVEAVGWALKKAEPSPELNRLIHAVLGGVAPGGDTYVAWMADPGGTEVWQPGRKILWVDKVPEENYGKYGFPETGPLWSIFAQTVHPEDSTEVLNEELLKTFQGSHKEATAHAKELAEERGEDEEVLSWAH